MSGGVPLRLGTWVWRLMHPVAVARAYAPAVLPLNVRLALLKLRPKRSAPSSEALLESFENGVAGLPHLPLDSGETPRVSIVIVSYNNARLMKLCLQSIYRLSTFRDFEVIVVDNASTDETRAMLKSEAAELPQLRLIFNASNVGFPAASNIGARDARGGILCFLNNDTVVSPDWLTALTRAVADPRVGIAGPTTNAIANEARVRTRYSSFSEFTRFSSEIFANNAMKRIELRTVAFFCAAIRKEVWRETGELDERFGIGMFEDDDYCRRLRERGYSTVCARDAFVHHWQMASFKLLENDEYLALYRRNRAIYRAKWASGRSEHERPIH